MLGILLEMFSNGSHSSPFVIPLVDDVQGFRRESVQSPSFR